MMLKSKTILMLILIALSCGLSSCERLYKVKYPKVMVFGVDAATWKALNPMLKAGELPVLQNLIDRGSHAEMIPMLPSISVMLWTTIATGVGPDRHGIKSWISDRPERKGQLAISSNMRRVPAYWELASKQNRPTLTANWWASWPAEPVNGVMISNWAHFASDDRIVFPAEYTQLLSNIPRKSKAFIEAEMEKTNPYKKPFKLTEFGIKSLQRDMFYLDAAEKIMQESNFDVISLYTRSVDILEHKYLGDLAAFPDALGKTQSAHGIIEAYYKWLDAQLGRFIELAGKDTTIIYVSDHGMEPVSSDVEKQDALQIDQMMAAIDLIPKTAEGKVDIEKAPLLDNQIHPPGLTRGLTFNRSNLEEGVDPEEYLKKAEQALRTFQIEGQPLFDEVIRRNSDSEIFSVKFRKFTIENNAMITYNAMQIPLKSVTLFYIHPMAGQHWDAPAGVFVAAGPGVRNLSELMKIDVRDVGPTIMALAGIPVAKDLDGKPLLPILDMDQLQGKKIDWVDTYGTPRPEAIPIPSEFDDVTQQELKALGYIN